MRLDGKSQYQIKKEKLQKIKAIIDQQNELWKKIRTGQIPEEQPKIASEVIKAIWEIVKDE